MNNNLICKSEYSFNDINFCEIFDFFVIKTPIEKASYRAISFKKRNIKNQNEILNNMKKISPQLFLCFECVEENENIEEILKKNEILKHINKPYEFAIYRLAEKLNKTQSFFYRIRCSLAHGSFCIHEYDGEKYYYFLNSYKEKYKHKDTLYGMMILKENTLLQIIKICDSKM